MRGWLALGLFACGPEPAAPPTGTRGTVPPAPPTLQADCALAPDHALHAHCTVDVAPPTDVAVEVVAVDAWPDDPVLTTRRSAADTTDLDLRRLRPETAYRWTVRLPTHPSVTVEGTLTTGALPPSAEIEVVHEVPPPSDLLHLSPCDEQGTLVVTAPDGGVVDYLDLPPQRLVGFRRTPDGHLLLLEGDDIVERDRMGRERLRIPGVDHGLSLHHDLDVDEAGRYAALFQEFIDVEGEPDPLLVNGMVMFDADGTLLRTWRLADHLPPERHPTRGVDIHHMNSLQLVDGLAILSVRHRSMVIALHADPDADTFGTVAWTLQGNEAMPWDLPLAIGKAPPGPDPFRAQHDVTLHPDGLLSMFDNRMKGLDSRALVFALDLEAGTADIVSVLPLDTHCGYQGGMLRAPDGTWVASCAPWAHHTTFAGSRRLGTTEMACLSGETGMVHRLIPWSAPGG